MNGNEAIEILKKRVEIDRKLRDNSTESDYDKFCENECIAIETLIEEYARLEEENKELLEVRISASADYRIRQLEEENRELEKENIKLRGHVHFKNCENCGREFKCKRNDAKYCENCSKKVNNSNWYNSLTEKQKEERKEKSRLAMQKSRAKKKMHFGGEIDNGRR